MRTIGLVGGATWLSSADYYAALNRGINARLGKAHSAKCVVVSLDMQELVDNNESGNLPANGVIVVAAAKRLKSAGAHGILIGANTLHMFADRVEDATGLPVLHIGTATGEEAARRGFSRVGLLGTRYVTEMEFYRERLERCGVQVVVPGKEDRDYVHRNIFDELALDRFTDEARKRYLAIIDELVGQGGQGIVMGCTEIPILLRDVQAPVPLLDTTRLHVEAAIEFMLG